jgi:hypothetical protein
VLHVLLKRRFLPSLPVLLARTREGGGRRQNKFVQKSCQRGCDDAARVLEQGKSCGGGHTWHSIGCEVCGAAEAASCTPSRPATSGLLLVRRHE